MRQRGFTLVELSIVLIIIALVAGMLFGISTSLLDVQRAEATRAKLKAIDAALASFVAVNKRLPCPADGTLPSASAGAGSENNAGGDNPCGSQQYGVVPWTALGLAPADIEDGWGSRITYRLDYVLARPNAMDMSLCDPAGTGTAQPAAYATQVATCTATSGICSAASLTSCVAPSLFLAGQGLMIKDASNDVLMDPGATPPTGAAYVLVSPGENRSGGLGSNGALLAATGAPEGSAETANRADRAFTRGTSFYVDTPQNFTTDATRFDDFVSRPSLIAVIQRASLGPRSHN